MEKEDIGIAEVMRCPARRRRHLSRMNAEAIALEFDAVVQPVFVAILLPAES